VLASITRPYFAVRPDAPGDQFVAKAARHPVLLLQSKVISITQCARAKRGIHTKQTKEVGNMLWWIAVFVVWFISFA
jgi:hypothetical protein